MVNMIKNEIETIGFEQIVTGATRFWPGKSDSLIDHCWTNCQDKILSNQNVRNGTADHNSIEIVQKVKAKIGAPVDI